MPSVNKVIIIGHLGRDPEIKHLQNNTALANFSVATSESWKDKNTGEWQEKTEWHRVSAWRQAADKVERLNLRKGSLVYVEGKLETRKYTDKDGVEKYSTEIVAYTIMGLDKKEKAAKAPAPDGYNDDGTPMSDEELPF